MPQLSYQDQRDLPAFEGGLYDTAASNDIVSRTPGGNTAQVATITLSGTPGNTETYTVTFNGVPISFTTDASGTLPELYAGLLAALLASPYVNTVVDVTGNGTTIITLTALEAGVPFTLTETLDASGNLALATATANVTGNPVPFGRLIIEDGQDVAVLPSGTFLAGVIAGVSVNRAKARPQDNSVDPPVTGEAQYGASETVPVLRHGRIWVKVAEAVSAGDAVRIQHTQGANPLHTVGRFRTTAEATKSTQLTAGARYVTDADAEGLALLEFNIFSMALTNDT